ncbi:hypothetical protein GCM10023068_44130 [Leifsonia shinshuensis]
MLAPIVNAPAARTVETTLFLNFTITVLSVSPDIADFNVKRQASGRASACEAPGPTPPPGYRGGMTPSSKSEAFLEADGIEVRISNPEKVVFPERD